VTKRSIFFALLMLFCQLSVANSGEGEGKEGPAKSAPGSIKSTYMRLEPPIIANYGTATGRLRFLSWVARIRWCITCQHCAMNW